jgi:hypothetical protein
MRWIISSRLTKSNNRIAAWLERALLISSQPDSYGIILPAGADRQRIGKRPKDDRRADGVRGAHGRKETMSETVTSTRRSMEATLTPLGATAAGRIRALMRRGEGRARQDDSLVEHAAPRHVGPIRL